MNKNETDWWTDWFYIFFMKQICHKCFTLASLSLNDYNFDIC